LIYESPDKGETVYSREVGTTERTLVSESSKAKSMREQLIEDKMWGEIRRLAKTNPTLKDAVDKVIMVYHLVKKQ
jgi:hypothetical protein